jgi:hypothetical protein
MVKEALTASLIFLQHLGPVIQCGYRITGGVLCMAGFSVRRRNTFPS